MNNFGWTGWAWSTRTGTVFSILVDTTVSSGTTVTLPLNGTVDCLVDWGDGSTDAYESAGNRSHEYASEGQYTITVTGSVTQFGAGASTQYSNVDKIIRHYSYGDLGITNLTAAYFGASNLVQVPAQLPPGVTALRETFRNATAFNGPEVQSWNTSSVATFLRCFDGATSFNQNLGIWDVGAGLTFDRMFQNANAFTGADLDLWDFTMIITPNGLNNFLNLSAHTKANYDLLLLNWDSYKENIEEVLAPRTSAQYSAGAPAAARAALVAYGWAITDGGEAT